MKISNLMAALAFTALPLVAGPAGSPLWLRYPALSPDGKTIVFCYQGDLYRVPSAGGAATPLTLGQAFNTRPVWSPDGKFIAFASDRFGNFDVFLMPAEGGEARRLTFHSAPDFPSAFTPDGQRVLFVSNRVGTATNLQFPNRSFAHTFTVPVTGGQARIVHTATMESAVYDASGTRILFHNLKGYEDPWRKHHTSSVARDICLFDTASGLFRALTSEPGEHRNPIFGAGESIYYLAERGGSFNVFRSSLDQPERVTQVTKFKKHPVRFLSGSKEGTLCYAYDGELYIQREGSEPAKVGVRIQVDGRPGGERILPVNGGLTEFAVAPSGKEVAFVARGELFVSNAEGTVTKRITNTAVQERSVTFSPDGRTLLYAAERKGTWGLYTMALNRKEEPYFFASTVLKETCILSGSTDVFQPLFSPDGKEVAFLEERTALKVLNLTSGKVRTLLPEGKNYSYADGDQDFTWSPDGKWLLLAFDPPVFGGIREVGLLAADGTGQIINLTRSGFDDSHPRFSADGSMVYWATDQEGTRNLNQDSATVDVFGLFLTQKAWDRFQLGKEDFALLKEREEKEKKDQEKTKEKDKDKGKEKDAKVAEPLAIDWKGLEDRRVRLTTHTSSMADNVISKDGEKLFYLAKFEKGFDLWSCELRTKETKLVAKLEAKQAALERTEDGKAIFVLADGKLSKVDPESGKRENLAAATEMVLRPDEERAYIFDHAWRQIGKKFYVPDLHGVNWLFYRDAYRKFLPHIQNNYDFAELLSEMLGELNASHTGCRYNPPQGAGDATASLGLFFDPYAGTGLQVTEVLKKGPLDLAASRVKPGHWLEAIDGVGIRYDQDVSALLNRKAGRFTLLTFHDSRSGERWDESIKPITAAQENALLYRRWVERERAETERLSGGRIGYVHVQGMNDPSMRTVVEEVLGKHLTKEAIVVDTRFNGGGNLHETLSDFLSGKKYFDIIPHGQYYGYQPQLKWIKPSIVLMSEGNYSDAHLFPVAYKLKGLGQTVGMPVPGTGTFVWWEPQIDPTLVFGIPEGGWRTPDGKFCENIQLEPDLKVPNDPTLLGRGRDQQLEAAVEALLKGLKKP